MMYSNRSEYSDRRPYSDRSSRHCDAYDDRREEKRKSYRDAPQDFIHMYSGDRQSSMERKSTEYSDSPKGAYNKDLVRRDWNRKSPVRRRMSSPDHRVSEKKKRKFTEDDEDDYKYRREPDDKKFGQSPDSFSHLNVTKDLKYRKSPPDSRYKHRQEDLTYRKQHDQNYSDRERCERSWDRPQQRTRTSQDCSTRSCAKPRERNDVRSLCDDKMQFSVNGSCDQSFVSDFTNQSPPIPEQRATKGFQRFLDVLNKGVNVATLTKIVTQTSTGVHDRPQSMSTADGLMMSPSSAGRQQENVQNNHWGKHEVFQKLFSSQPHHRAFSPVPHSLSDEKSLRRSDGEQHFFSSNSRSRSPSVVEKIPLTPEDEHKHKQMQDVLQAIGMDLGFEELGQMSHRIQERLYGKDYEGSRGRKDRDTRRTLSPSRRRSSSNRSNLSPSTQDCFMVKDYSAHRDVTEVHQSVEYGQHTSISYLQDSEKCETNSQGSSSALETSSLNPTYSLSEAPFTPVMPTYSPLNYSLLPYPAIPSSLPPAVPTSLSSTMPTTLPHVVPGLFLPRLPALLPYPQISPLNIFPAVLGQSRTLLPHPISHQQSSVLNLPAQPISITQKSKTLSRPRCLQVIETKQPG